ncbi:MAG TPA: SDR family oxidoreductase [Pseudonocardia sp.]|jgi:NAD(P)-dependent dehydrogenase (short-subunit alcohol dehydrogenase family)
MKDLTGKVAVVTGGGSGIGRALCLRLAGKGAVVAVCDLREQAAKDTAASIIGAGGRASVHQVDVAAEEQMRALVDAVLAEHGVVDAVVNNAGISTAPEPTVETSLATFHKVLEVNLWGVIHGSTMFLPHLVSRPAANLVNVCSFAGLMGMTAMSPYNISKFGVRGLTEALQMEFATGPLRVSLVCPGGTRTALMENSPVIAEDKRGALHRNLNNSTASKSPEYVADAIVHGILTDRTRILVGSDTKMIDKLTRFLPAAYPKIMHKRLAKMYVETLGS